MTQVVDAELAFEAVPRRHPGCVHDAGVVDETVQSRLRLHHFGRPPDRVQMGEVEFDDSGIGIGMCSRDPLHGVFALLHGTTSQ